MLSQKIKELLLEVLKKVEPSGAGFASADEIPLETPRMKEHGDYATNLPFALAKTLKRPPMKIAEELAGVINAEPSIIQSAEAAKPGFLNLRIDSRAYQENLLEAIKEGDSYGRCNAGKGQKAQVEFVSANPTGPLSVGHGRLAAFGDALARLLEAAGYEVEREYYVNNVGNQIKRLGVSFDLRYREQLGETIDIEEGGYLGEYLVDYAKKLVEENGDRLMSLETAERQKKLAGILMDWVMDDHRETLHSLGVDYQNWFLESSLHEEDKLTGSLNDLEKAGHTYEKDEAIWFRSSEFSDHQDRVLKKANGLPTYFLSDIAYHRDKFKRGFDVVIDIWGADHHGYIERLKSAMEANGISPDRLEVLIIQLVRFKESGILLRMSKRRGNFIALADLVEEIGADVTRLFFLMRSKDSHLEFDLELAKQKSEANPLYYLQYAHARICSILAKAEEEGLKAASEPAALDPLADEAELDLMKGIADFPWEVEGAALIREPHRIIHSMTQFAGRFHNFYHRCKVLSDDPALTAARLALCDASRVRLKNGLSMMGLSAPESM